ncbi:MAG: glycosyltransferase family 2 protein [Rhizomicrobium sp.]
MNSRPEVSVLMANYNGARHLVEAIASVRNQTLQSWELIFVDDASQDGSAALAAEASQGDARVRLIAQSVNRGPAAARNRAIDAALGRWLAIFDSDDVMLRERLATLLARASADGAQIVADNLLLFSDEAQRPRPFLRGARAKQARWIGLAEFIDSNRLYSREPDLGYLKPFVDADLLRRSQIRYDARLRIGEDYDFLARLLARGPQLRLEPSALYLYRRHRASTSWRLRHEHIRALLDAHERFLSGSYLLNSEELRALGRRRRSLQSMLLYDEVVDMLKSGRYRQAVRASVRAPRIWPLLTRPLRARFARRIGRQRPAAPCRAATT